MNWGIGPAKTGLASALGASDCPEVRLPDC
jgi:hypothetical protein